MKSVSITRSPGLQIYAFPDRTEGFSIADWITHRVQLIEGTGANTGIYIGELDESKSNLWRFFEGESQPTGWDQAKGFFDLSSVPVSGDYLLTATITDADTTDAIEGAKITLIRTGERTAGVTNSSGVATVGVDAATWTYIIRANGYEFKNGTVVVTDDTTLNVELDSIVLPVTANDNQVTAFYLCLDEDGNPEQGVEVTLYAEEAVDAVDGIALSELERTATSDSNGYATFTNVTVGYSYVITVNNIRQFTVNVPASAESPLALRSIVR
jgi:hypothetical protein